MKGWLTMNTRHDYEYIREHELPGWQEEWRRLLEGRWIVTPHEISEDPNAKLFRLGFSVAEIAAVIGHSGLTTTEADFLAAHPDWYTAVDGQLVAKAGYSAYLAAAERAKKEAEMWELIKIEREARINGGVLVGAYWFHSDGYSRIQHLGLKDEVKDTSGVDADVVVIDGEAVAWRTMSGQFVPMTRGLVKDIVKAIKTLDKRLFKAAEIHRAAMEASVDPDTYDFSTGWPARYGD